VSKVNRNFRRRSPSVCGELALVNRTKEKKKRRREEKKQREKRRGREKMEKTFFGALSVHWSSEEQNKLIEISSLGNDLLVKFPINLECSFLIPNGIFVSFFFLSSETLVQ